MTDSGLWVWLFILFLLFIAALVGLGIVYNQYQTLKQKSTDYARRVFERWREKELEHVKQQAMDLAKREVQVQFEEWKQAYESKIRQDAIQKSQSVTMGKITEHFIPYLPEFRYNPKDARFLGSPVDLIVFDGLSEGHLEQIVFLEIKSGQAGLSQRERFIRDAVQNGKVKWETLRHNSAGEASLPEA